MQIREAAASKFVNFVVKNKALYCASFFFYLEYDGGWHRGCAFCDSTGVHTRCLSEIAHASNSRRILAETGQTTALVNLDQEHKRVDTAVAVFSLILELLPWFATELSIDTTDCFASLTGPAVVHQSSVSAEMCMASGRQQLDDIFPLTLPQFVSERYLANVKMMLLWKIRGTITMPWYT